MIDSPKLRGRYTLASSPLEKSQDHALATRYPSRHKLLKSGLKCEQKKDIFLSYSIASSYFHPDRSFQITTKSGKCITNFGSFCLQLLVALVISHFSCLG